MAEPTCTTKIIERCRISPPPDSVPPTVSPLTFFDFPWLFCIPSRLFFFELPHPTHHFTLTVLPKLKHSLSLALRHFFPFAAHLVCPPPPLKPHLLYSPGGSVSFTVAESDADFNALLSNDPRDATECHYFVPELPRASSDRGGTRAFPLLAIQVTVFPNSGFAIGATFNHVAADGRAFHHFVKSWSFFCRSAFTTGQELTPVEPLLESPPSHDRNAIVDQNRLEPIFLKDWWATGSNDKDDTGHNLPQLENIVRATFIMGQAHIEKLKRWVSAQCKDEEEASTLRASSFVVTVAFTWVNLIRSQLKLKAEEDKLIPNGDEAYHLCFSADCRSRSGVKYPIPATYFGNCLAICFASIKRSEVCGENGVFYAAKAIGETIRDLDRGALRGAETWMSNFKEKSETGKLVTVAGAASLGVYQTDFGWGKPRKSQAVHIDESGAISVAECMEEGGGLEIGLALKKDKMDIFSVLFDRSLKVL